MAEIIAPGTTLANSADFTVVAGTPRTLYIKPNGMDGPASAGDYFIQWKDSGGFYHTSITLNSANITDKGTIFGAGTFRAQRQPSVYSTGMDLV
jgi:hypothetical protein